MTENQDVKKPLSKEAADLEKQGNEIELQRAELELRRLELLERKANLQDVQERLEERELKRTNRRQVFLGRGQNLIQDRAKKDGLQKGCNHRKGGDGARGVVGGEGTDPQYAVIKHRMANGDVWVRCLRCGKTWKPPVKSMHKTEASYNAAMERYEVAAAFPTRNHTSSSQQFEWGYNEATKEGGKEFYREKMKSVTLE